MRVAAFDDLLRLQQEAQDARLTARWSSREALLRQVEPDTTAILAPALRNGHHEDRPDSYRCHIWFVQHSDRSARTVSLFDVTEASLSALPEAASPDQLCRLVRMLLDGMPLDAIW